LPFPYTVAVAAAIAYLFAVYGCNGTEFSYVIFAEQQNFTTAERRNGNGMVETRHNAWFPSFFQTAGNVIYRGTGTPNSLSFTF